jgi:hypothetical protein
VLDDVEARGQAMKLVPEYSRPGFRVGIQIDSKTRILRGAGRSLWPTLVEGYRFLQVAWGDLALTSSGRKTAYTQECLAATRNRSRTFGRRLPAINGAVFTEWQGPQIPNHIPKGAHHRVPLDGRPLLANSPFSPVVRSREAVRNQHLQARATGTSASPSA